MAGAERRGGRGTKYQGTLDLVSCPLLSCHLALGNTFNLLGSQSLHLSNGQHVRCACPVCLSWLALRWWHLGP